VWKIIWTVITNVLIITITFLSFGHASTDFERLALCLIILIYQSVNWSHTTQMRMAIEEAFVVRTLFVHLLKKGGEETEAAGEEIAEASKKYQRLNTIYYINLVCCPRYRWQNQRSWVNLGHADWATEDIAGVECGGRG